MIKISSIFLCILFATALHAQGGYWQQLNGPAGGNIQAITVGSDSSVYLVTNQDIFKRSPSDHGWTRVEVLPFSPDFSYSSSIVPGSPRFISAFGRLFIIGDPPSSGSGPVQATSEGIIISSDGGKTWSDTAMRIGICNGIAIANGALYALGYDSNRSAIYKSNDSGFTWRIIFEDTITFNYITGCPTETKLYLSTNLGVFTNMGEDTLWRLVDSVQNGNWGEQIFEVDSTICISSETNYLGDSHTPLFRTSNGGRTWDTIAYLGAIGPITKDSNGVLWLASAWNRVLMSSDSGLTWADGHFFSGYNYSPLPTFCVSPTGAVLLATSDDVYRFSRVNNEWLPWNDSLKIQDVISLIPINDDSIVAYCWDGYYRTSDAGQSWTKDSIAGYLQESESPLLRDRNGYLYNNSFKYDPSQKEWTELVTTNQVNPVVATIDSLGYLYAPTVTSSSRTALLRSTDHGGSWIDVFDNSYNWNSMTVDPKGRILASVVWGIIRSSDHGVTWDTILDGGNVWYPFDAERVCVTQNSKIIVSCSGYLSMQSYFTMVQSTDDGTSWQIASSTITPLSFALSGDSIVYFSCGLANTNGSGVMKSLDGGNTFNWVSFSNDTEIRPIAVNPNATLYAGTVEDGLFRYIPAASSVETSVSSPENFTIFPNPATNQIQIISGVGNISILDPLGRSYEVKQTGNTLDVSALPSGVYFVSDGQSRAKFVKQ